MHRLEDERGANQDEERQRERLECGMALDDPGDGSSEDHHDADGDHDRQDHHSDLAGHAHGSNDRVDGEHNVHHADLGED